MNRLLAILESPEKSFLVIGLLFGALFAVVNPPFQAPDENRHLYRAYQLAEFNVFGDRRGTELGGWLPRGLIACAEEMTDLRHHPERKYRIDITEKLLRVPLQEHDRTYVSFASAKYFPLAYFPQTLGIWISNLLHVRPLRLLYISRLCGLIGWVALCYLAIRVIPFFKWTLFLLALTPMSLYQGASVTADSITNALAFVTIAHVFRLAYDGKDDLRLSELAIFFALTVCLSLSKTVYLPVALLALIIPVHKFGSRRRWATTIVALLAVNVALLSLWMAAFKGTHLAAGPEDVLPETQLAQVFENPMQLLNAIYNSIRLFWAGYIKTFIGVLGWVDTPLTTPHYWSWGILLLVAALIETDYGVSVRFAVKIFALSIFVGIGAACFAVMYLIATPVGSDFVSGFQGRYLIPVALLFLLLLFNGRLNFTNSLLWKGVVFSTCLSLGASIYVLNNRFY